MKHEIHIKNWLEHPLPVSPETVFAKSVLSIRRYQFPDSPVQLYIPRTAGSFHFAKIIPDLAQLYIPRPRAIRANAYLRAPVRHHHHTKPLLPPLSLAYPGKHANSPGRGKKCAARAFAKLEHNIPPACTSVYVGTYCMKREPDTARRAYNDRCQETDRPGDIADPSLPRSSSPRRLGPPV